MNYVCLDIKTSALRLTRLNLWLTNFRSLYSVDTSTNMIMFMVGKKHVKRMIVVESYIDEKSALVNV